jgi:hypothetical protein
MLYAELFKNLEGVRRDLDTDVPSDLHDPERLSDGRQRALALIEYRSRFRPALAPSKIGVQMASPQRAGNSLAAA